MEPPLAYLDRNQSSEAAPAQACYSKREQEGSASESHEIETKRMTEIEIESGSGIGEQWNQNQNREESTRTTTPLVIAEGSRPIIAATRLVRRPGASDDRLNAVPGRHVRVEGHNKF
ncbi:hypothetical protein EVAR_22773_1 [Eumeta japonica]|uniref:Uncharacterized protein n=1 Tax=Eumeta variegata TaxID=151549 RepID=A0A4C1UT46_EUMVA|nr:hypothetical protein EVAR_22773_1 [Eumeta japonica]